jgi:multiple sugar transport system substrate-binding protein
MSMSQEIELSIMADSPAGLQPLLDQFEAEQGIHVRPRLLSWDTAWSDLVKVALYSHGPDVSEIGNTWLGDLVAMNALREFSSSEIGALGKASAFLPLAWQGTRLVGQPETWAIPWVTGMRLLFYRRHLLSQAGIDEDLAFHTAGALNHTVSELQTNGIQVPWTVPTGLTHTTLLNITSWVWGAGGDFISPDGKLTLFSQPAALAGIRAYFALGRFLAPSVRHLNGLQPDDQFLKDSQTAMTISGPWLFNQVGPELAAQLGVALPPGASLVGGSHLVIWKHCPQPEAALKLIQFLTGTPAQIAYGQHVGLLPVTLEALSAPPFSTDPLWQLAIRGVKTGRTLPVTRSWGLMEDRLTSALSAIWTETLNTPDPDLEIAIAKRLEPLARRLDLVLGQS